MQSFVVISYNISISIPPNHNQNQQAQDFNIIRDNRSIYAIQVQCSGDSLDWFHDDSLLFQKQKSKQSVLNRKQFQRIGIIFQMEKTQVSKLLLIFSLILGALGQTNFAGLNIDPVLLGQADAAINDLKSALQNNFNCQPRFSLFGSIFGKTFFPFHSIVGFSGFNASPPQILCMFGQGSVYYSIYQKITKVINLLQQVRKCLIQYNNIIIGSQNNITGSNNMVIGSRDNFKGDNNWVFTSDYTATDPLNGVLILGVYLIELNDLMHITYNPGTVIHCIEQGQSNQHFFNFWTKSTLNRRFAF